MKRGVEKTLSWTLPVLSVVLFLLAGCGYHFTGEGDGPRPGLQRIAIPVFENDTSEPDLGSIFAGALRTDFMQKGNLLVVPVDEADAVFRGRIINIYTTDIAHREAEETIETRLYVTLDIRCTDTRTGAVIWRDPKFTYFRAYLQNQNPEDPNPIVSFDRRRVALEYLAREMSIRIHDRFLSNF